ncbi:uncharacterized protein LOC113330473 [Papaver somniferum]|uniref:uncharacterized protein LOC113330473 n=1 Tax=Papaver somniferum TaxID=3469 RepID=UPI000E7013A1|nr:uncharacterized protein LOC113330473 [Papaver somniferum]
MGDFNCVLRNDEKKGGREPKISVVTDFSDWMDDNNLFEADSLGSKYTWANGQSGVRRILCKLDRVIINEAWLAKFENWWCKTFPREVSYRSTLVGYPFRHSRPRRAPFRIQKMWFTRPDFMNMDYSRRFKRFMHNSVEDLKVLDFLKVAHRQVKFHEPVEYRWSSPALDELQRWSEVSSNFEAIRFEHTFREANFSADNMAKRGCDLPNEERRHYTGRPDFLNSVEYPNFGFTKKKNASDEDLEDETKLNYVKEASVSLENVCMQHAIMLKQKSRNKWLVEVASNTAFFHANIQTRRSSNVISELVHENNTTITGYEQLKNYTGMVMDAIPSMEEVKTVVLDLGADSAPGPDGFSGCFYRHCWDVIHQDIFNAISYCWMHKIIHQGVNSSLLILLAKILATRLGGVLDRLVSEEQVAFMKGRNIHETISVVSEMVNELKNKRKDGNVGLKLDISPVFDTVSWSFVLEVFRSSARISVLLNGSPEGLGDPLSPLIFVLIEDVLSRNLTKFFFNKIMTPMLSIKAASGQTVCRQKSKVYYGGNSLSRCRTITDLLGMEVSTFPDRYLGVQIIPRGVKYRQIWNVIDKIKNQLSVWRGKLLSLQDRVVLINSVIDSYSIHNMVVYKWPRKFIDQREGFIRNFLWSGDAEVSRKFVVSYDKVSFPKKEGGLGITKLYVTNKALLMKLWWNIRSSKKKWARFLYDKYTNKKGRIKEYGVKSSILPGIKQVYKEHNNVNDLLVNNEWVIPDSHIQNLLNAGVNLDDLPRPLAGDDFRVWMPDLKGKFSVSLAKCLIRNKYAVTDVYSLLWRKVVHPNLAAQNWNTERGVCATLDKVQSRFKISPVKKCYLCKMEEESLDHVLWSCAFAGQPIKCFWNPPPRNVLLICCDEASRNNPGRAGAGVVARDANCNMVGAMSIGMVITNNFMEEVFGILVGLEWATQWGMQHILVRSDSISVVEVFTNSSVHWLIKQRWDHI